MAIDSTLKGFERRWVALANVYTEAPAKAVAASANVYATTTRSYVNAATHGGKLRNVGKRGSRVGVKMTLNGNSATVQATGPLQIVERDTKDHDIPQTRLTRRGRTAAGRLSHKRVATGRTSSGNKLLVINGNIITGPVRHPGTKGKHPFERAADAAEIPARNAARDATFNAIGKVFS